jgi:hypothetical protein
LNHYIGCYSQTVPTPTRNCSFAVGLTTRFVLRTNSGTATCIEIQHSLFYHVGDLPLDLSGAIYLYPYAY